MPLVNQINQVRRASNGQMVEIASDVFDICNRITEVDPSLGIEARVCRDAQGREILLYRLYEEGYVDGVWAARTVCWFDELTPDIPGYVQRMAKTDYVKGLEAIDRQAERDQDHAHHERVGPIGERMAYALRKDLGVKNRAFIHRSIG